MSAKHHRARQLALSKDSSSGSPRRLSAAVARASDFVRSRAGMLGLLACVLPLGTSAIDCWKGALAGDYRAGASHVAFVGGCRRYPGWPRRCPGGWGPGGAWGAFQPTALPVPAWASRRLGWPRCRPIPACTSSGCCSTAPWPARWPPFNAYAFQLIASSRAASSVCGLFYGAVNLPLSYMLVVDGWAHTQAGRVGLFVTDGIICLIAVAGLVAMSRLRLRSVEPQLSVTTKGLWGRRAGGG